MVVQPMVRNNICLNAHPKGCVANVGEQIEYTKKRTEDRKAGTLNGLNERADNGRAEPKNVLVVGCSTGYGLASRITAAFGYGAATIGVSLEKAGSESKWGTPGWYNNLAFDKAAKDANLTSVTLDGDAFSYEMKDNVIAEAKKLNMKFDLVVYSLASPVRTDPATGILHRSVLRPIGKSFSGKTIDPLTGVMKELSAPPATEDEIANTVKVMGGEDWKMWIDKLSEAGVLADGAITVAYSYIGPEQSKAIYRYGTIGKAKDDLEKTAHTINDDLKKIGGGAYVSVNKGLVTRSSAVIPIIPLYLSAMFKVTKAQGKHEGCIEQMNRLFDSRIYGTPKGAGLAIAEKLGCKNDDANISVDDEHRIRIDDWELDDDVQKELEKIMPSITPENFAEITDLEGYKHDFLATSGFDIAGVDYTADVERFDEI